MRLNEPLAELRRIYLVIRDVDGVLVEDATGYAPGELVTSANGAALTAAAGTLVAVSGGLHYYEGTAGDASVAGFLWVRLDGSGWFGENWAVVGSVFRLGEADADRLRLPFTIYDADSDLVAGVDSDPGVSTTTSMNGAAPGAPAGFLVEVSGGDGLYYYQGVAAEAAALGVLAIIVTSDISEPAIAYAEIDAAITSAEAPSIEVVSPDPDADPGDPGGFSDDLSTAQQTPIVLEIDGADGVAYACVVCRYPSARNEIVVYAKGDFRGEFAASSSQEIDGTILRLTCLPDGGWPDSGDPDDITFDVDAIGGDGSTLTSTRI